MFRKAVYFERKVALCRAFSSELNKCFEITLCKEYLSQQGISLITKLLGRSLLFLQVIPDRLSEV